VAALGVRYAYCGHDTRTVNPICTLRIRITFVNAVCSVWTLYVYCEYGTHLVNTVRPLWIWYVPCEHGTHIVKTVRTPWTWHAACEHSMQRVNTVRPLWICYAPFEHRTHLVDMACSLWTRTFWTHFIDQWKAGNITSWTTVSFSRTNPLDGNRIILNLLKTTLRQLITWCHIIKYISILQHLCNISRRALLTLKKIRRR
jgi:hypothetical protein